MKNRVVLQLVVLSCCLLFLGCKKNTAFLVVDAETKQPLPNTLVDHWKLYVSGENTGEPYLGETVPLDENGRVEFKTPQKGASFKFRLAGYEDTTVRMTKPSEVAERVVYGGPKVKEWIKLETVEDEDRDDKKVTTFIVPLKKN